MFKNKDAENSDQILILTESIQDIGLWEKVDPANHIHLHGKQMKKEKNVLEKRCFSKSQLLSYINWGRHLLF